jgi:hypothetical protein
MGVDAVPGVAVSAAGVAGGGSGGGVGGGVAAEVGAAKRVPPARSATKTAAAPSEAIGDAGFTRGA